MWYKISLQQKKNPIKDTGIFLCICASQIHIEHFPSFPLSTLPPSADLMPRLCRCLSTSPLLICIEPLSEISTTVTCSESRGCQSAVPGRLKSGDGEKAKNKPKAEEGGRGRGRGGGGKVNIISFLTPWDRKQPPHTVKVQKVKALNQLLQLMWMSARVSLHERNTNTSGRGSAPTYLADY